MGETWRWLRFLVRRRQFDRDLEEEMRFHLEMRAAADGSPAGARRRFGNLTPLREDSRAAWGWAWLDRLAQDLRHAARMLRKSPGFTAAAVFTLALGIGANTVMFSIVDGILLRPFPYRQPERLVNVWTWQQAYTARVMNAVPDYLDWRARNQVFEDMGACLPTAFDLRGRDYPQRMMGQRATASLFSTLGVQPQLGRLFLPEEQRDGADRAVLLSDAFWRARFHADPRAVGSTLLLNRNSDGYEKYTVVGVLPPSLHSAFPKHADIWGALALDGDEAQHRMSGLNVLARLKPGISLGRAEESMRALASGLAALDPNAHRARSVQLLDFHESETGYGRPELAGLMGAVVFVLLIACVNVANLMLARGEDRRREMAVRAAIGAGRARLFRQSLTESLGLALAGGAAGTLLAFWGVRLAKVLIPAGIPRADEVAVDARVLLFTAAVSIFTGMLFGLLPAWRASRPNLQPALQAGRGPATPKRAALRHSLVVAEIVLGLVLLAGAGLMLNSFARLLQVDPGFDRHDVLGIHTALPWQRFKDKSPAYRRAVLQQVLARVRAVPGVRFAGISDFLPLGNTMNAIFHRPEAPGKPLVATTETVAGDYFQAMGTRLLRGRLFAPQDGLGAPPVAILNETAARRYWPGEEPLGRQITVGQGREQRACTVVGVVADVRRKSLDHPADPAFYTPQAQDPPLLLDLVIRTQPGVPPMDIAAAVRKELAAVDSGLAADQVATMESVVAGRLSRPRFLTVVLGVFGLLALALTATGVYGVMAYSVRARTHEIGVRMALGAGRRDVLALILRRGGILVALGLALGTAAALAATRLLASMLYQVKPSDPATFAAVGLLLAGVALAANFLPARRAARVDPSITLRWE